MAYDDDRQGDDGRWGRQEQGGRGYRGAGELGGYGREADPARRDFGRGDYGARDYGQRDYAQRDGGQGGYGQGSYGRGDQGRSDYGQQDFGRGGYSAQRGRDQGVGSRGGDSYDRGERSRGWSGGDRTTEGFNGGTDYYRGDRSRGWGERGDNRSDRGPSRAAGYDQGAGGRDADHDRGFVARAGDEVRSWFGDEEAERRRERDAREGGRYDRPAGGDAHYHDWRDQQIQQFDRDYHEYRQENRQKFHNEFSSWRSERESQRALLGSVREHLEVVGSDGEHVGTVDKVRGDHVILTKSDADAGGRHHSFPSRWIKSVDDRVTLTRTAAEAKREWQDAERQSAIGGDRGADDERGTDLNRSFSNTY